MSLKQTMMAVGLLSLIAAQALAQTATPTPATPARPAVTPPPVAATQTPPAPARPATQAATPAQTKLVNINLATAQELDALPQIGDARAKAIIAGRPYRAVQDLLDRKIIPANAYAAIVEKVTVR